MNTVSPIRRQPLVPLVTPPPPLGALLLGQPVVEAAVRLGRIFNLCRAAQVAAARLAFGLPPEDGCAEALRREVLRDHLIKFHLSWPALLGCPPLPLPAGWAAGSPDLAGAMLGAPARMPATEAEFAAFLAGGQGLAGVLARIDREFAPGEAVCAALPLPEPRRVLEMGALENSGAARHAAHPVMQHIAGTRGRGPLWRATGRAYDMQACLESRLPPLLCPALGQAIVPAARGAYAIAAQVREGRVTAFQRVTPTDHLCAPGGILEQSLASLAATSARKAPLLLDILDPCTQVHLKGAQDA